MWVRKQCYLRVVQTIHELLQIKVLLEEDKKNERRLRYERNGRGILFVLFFFRERAICFDDFFLYFFLFLRVYFGEHEVLPGCGSDSSSSQSQPIDRSPVQHHMKERNPSKAFCKAFKQKQTILLKTKNESKQIQNVSKSTKSKNSKFCLLEIFFILIFI